jgi:uncharacterized protein
MRSPSTPFEFLVGDLLRHHGEERSERIEAPADIGVELSSLVPEEPLVVDLRLRGVSGGVLAEGTVRFTVRHRCYRCLVEWEEYEEVRFRELIATPDLAEAEQADYVLSGELLDLGPVVRDAVILELPLLPLCRDDCAGLCPTCGADLNSGACPGHDEVSTSPFAGLRDLLETQE